MANLQTKPDSSQPWIDPENGRPSPPFANYMLTVDLLLRLLNGLTLINAVNDAAAAAAGVPVGSLYRNGSIVMIRVA